MTRADAAVILVAGEGKRLRPFTEKEPKCFARVAGERILERTLKSLSASGCKRAVIVTGHHESVIRGALGAEYHGVQLQYINNPIYSTTNSMYSLLLGLEKEEGPCWVLEGDVFIDPQVLQNEIAHEIDWFVDSSARHLDGSFVGYDANCRAVTQGIFRDVSKVPAGHGKSVGILHLAARGTNRMKQWLIEAERKGYANKYYDLIVQEHLDEGIVGVVDIAGLKWFEIDTNDDLEKANRLFSR